MFNDSLGDKAVYHPDPEFNNIITQLGNNSVHGGTWNGNSGFSYYADEESSFIDMAVTFDTYSYWGGGGGSYAANYQDAAKNFIMYHP